MNCSSYLCIGLEGESQGGARDRRPPPLYTFVNEQVLRGATRDFADYRTDGHTPERTDNSVEVTSRLKRVIVIKSISKNIFNSFYHFYFCFLFCFSLNYVLMPAQLFYNPPRFMVVLRKTEGNPILRDEKLLQS